MSSLLPTAVAPTTSESTPAAPSSAATPGTSRPALEVHDLQKRFTRSDGVVVNAVDHTSLSVAAGEFLVLLGPSGCGKSTFLRCLAGLESPQLGTIAIGDRVLFDGARGLNLPPERRGVSMVFQSYALWPHMSVFKNVAYPLKVTRSLGLSKDEIARRVTEVLELVGIGHLADQYPSQISGGQQQRVALARALVQGSDVVLFDEPLSNVDARVRVQLRTEIRQMQQRLGFTAIYVTHDQEEALSLADRIAVIDSGGIAQLGTPQEVFLAPASMTVARFVGNLVEVEGTVVGQDDTTTTLATALGEIRGLPAAEVRVGDQAWATWRPDRTELAPALSTSPAPATSTTPTTPTNEWSGTVESSCFMGNYTDVTVRVGEVVLHHRRASSDAHPLGESVGVKVGVADVRILPA